MLYIRLSKRWNYDIAMHQRWAGDVKNGLGMGNLLLHLEAWRFRWRYWFAYAHSAFGTCTGPPWTSFLVNIPHYTPRMFNYTGTTVGTFPSMNVRNIMHCAEQDPLSRPTCGIIFVYVRDILFECERTWKVHSVAPPRRFSKFRLDPAIAIAEYYASVA